MNVISYYRDGAQYDVLSLAVHYHYRDGAQYDVLSLAVHYHSHARRFLSVSLEKFAVSLTQWSIFFITNYGLYKITCWVSEYQK